jgi:hypothetical protein
MTTGNALECGRCGPGLANGQAGALEEGLTWLRRGGDPAACLHWLANGQADAPTGRRATGCHLVAADATDVARRSQARARPEAVIYSVEKSAEARAR